MRDGIEHLAKAAADDDLIVTLDCDDTHEPKYLPAALKKIREGYDVVILSRYCPGGGEAGLSPVKAVLSRGAGFFLGVFFPIPGVREFSCGYRVHRASILKRAVERFGRDFIRLPHLGFVVTPEILIRLRMLGARIAESPFTLRYDQKPTKSKNKSLKTIQGYFALLWNYWGRRA
jgi:dolichol-phosphate mannosyltransferase